MKLGKRLQVQRKKSKRYLAEGNVQNVFGGRKSLRIIYQTKKLIGVNKNSRGLFYIYNLCI